MHFFIQIINKKGELSCVTYPNEVNDTLNTDLNYFIQ